MPVQKDRQTGLQLNPAQFFGSPDDRRGCRPAEIGYLVTAVVNQQGNVMVVGKIGPFPCSPECGKIELAKVRTAGNRHQAGIRTTAGVRPEAGR